MNQRVLIVGSVAVDDISTPAGAVKKILGGAAVYGSIIVSRFAPADIVGVCGDDFPQEHLQTLRDHGIDLRGLEIVPGGKTFHWGGEYTGDMNSAATHFTELGVYQNFEPKIPDAYRSDGFVFLANINPELQLSVLDQVDKPRLSICDTMNLWINIKRDVLMEVLRRVNVVLINDGEARLLCDTNSLPLAAERLLEMGIERIIIKKGSNGAQMFSREGTFAVPALPLAEIKDPTGAGDTFAGGLIGYLATQERLDEMAFRRAMLVGTACASFVVEDFSIRRTAGLDKAAIAGRCARLHAAIRCDPVCFS